MFTHPVSHPHRPHLSLVISILTPKSAVLDEMRALPGREAFTDAALLRSLPHAIDELELERRAQLAAAVAEDAADAAAEDAADAADAAAESEAAAAAEAAEAAVRAEPPTPPQQPISAGGGVGGVGCAVANRPSETRFGRWPQRQPGRARPAPPSFVTGAARRMARAESLQRARARVQLADADSNGGRRADLFSAGHPRSDAKACEDARLEEALHRGVAEEALLGGFFGAAAEADEVSAATAPHLFSEELGEADLPSEEIERTYLLDPKEVKDKIAYKVLLADEGL